MERKLSEMQAQVLPDQWFMLLVRRGKEQEARDSFRRYGLRAYWPNYHTIAHWSLPRRERRRRDYRSVTPGYLFVPALPSNTFWGVIEYNIGIVNVVRNYSGDMAVLKNADIEVIRSIEAGMNTPKPGKSLHSFKTGDKVRFTDDMLNRWPPGRVAGSIGDGRISVEVEVMGRIVPFMVFPHQIERA
jgi:transcription antitermination factor NusG